MRKRQHLCKRRVLNRLIDADQRKGLRAWRFPPKIEGGDIDAFGAEQSSERADIPRLVGVLRVKQVRREISIDRRSVDLDDARLSVGENGARDGALLRVDPHCDAHISLISALLAAADLLNFNAAFF